MSEELREREVVHVTIEGREYRWTCEIYETVGLCAVELRLSNGEWMQMVRHSLREGDEKYARAMRWTLSDALQWRPLEVS